jgi:peptidoglycan/xylan/chitin deacetylase (PgdA/CDA1 family)
MRLPIKLKQRNTLLSTLLTAFMALVTLAPAPLLGAVILQYHHVSTTTPAITSLSPQQFSEHMQYLKQQNFNVIALPTLIDAIRNKQPIADKTVVITFDDGYLNVYENARPILKQLDWPYTVFINSQFVDGKYSRHMNWDQLRQIAKEGATIANHTLKHDYLVRKPQDMTPEKWQQYISQDIQQVEKRIVQEIGHHYKLLAYPYGEFDNATKATLSKLGFVGIGQHSGPVNHSTDLTRVPRFPASGIYANLEKLKVKINSLAFTINQLDNANPQINVNPPTITIDVKVSDFNPKQLQCFSAGSDRAIVTWLNDHQFNVTAPKPLPPERSRYNCTAPSLSKKGHFYWFSQPWINSMKIQATDK